MLLLIILTSCSAIEVDRIEKEIVYPGRASEKKEIRYSASVEVKEPITITSLKIKELDNDLRFSVVKIPEGLVVDVSKELTSGTYYLTAYTEHTPFLSTSKDIVQIAFMDSKGKPMFFEMEADFRKSIVLRK